MKKETVKQYTILFQYILLLKEPTYIFLIQVFQHLSPATWWEDFIEPVLQRENKENFKYLDMSDLLNVFKMNWEPIFSYLDNSYYRSKYNHEYMIVNKVHKIRNIVAHANDIDMSPAVLVDSLAWLLKYAKIIRCDEKIIHSLESDWSKHRRHVPDEISTRRREEIVMQGILSIIDEKVLLNAVNSETLTPDIKLSVDRTALRLHSMRTLEEIMGFFNNAIRSERGVFVSQALHNAHLYAFEDIQEEVNRFYAKYFNP